MDYRILKVGEGSNICRSLNVSRFANDVNKRTDLEFPIVVFRVHLHVRDK
jgi:hypothetical protein